jgi:hypothetical protein
LTVFGNQRIDALFDGGCDDGVIGSSAGETTILFDRKGHSRKEAIDSAMAEVRRAGFDPELV